MPNVFLSYAHADDDRGLLTWLQGSLKRELRQLTGDDWQVFLDDDIATGQRWHKVIDAKIASTDFFVCFMSPSYFKSDICREELTLFLDREQRSGRDDLVMPVMVIPPTKSQANDRLFAACTAHQYNKDITHIRLLDYDRPEWRVFVHDIANDLVDADYRGTPLSLANLTDAVSTLNLQRIEREAVASGASPVAAFAGDESRYEGPFEVIFAQANASKIESVEEFAKRIGLVAKTVPAAVNELVRHGVRVGAVAEDLLVIALGAHSARNGARAIPWQRVYTPELAHGIKELCDSASGAR